MGSTVTTTTIDLDAHQRAAVDAATDCRLMLITGGAGTGKTTIIKEIARNVSNPLLCAFAGKAAARLREATGHSASTIHSLLRYNGARFMLGTLANKSLIIDEASMVSADLLAEIVNRRPARLILVGDAGQLPPVGKGQPFHDLLSIRSDLVCTLPHCYRASEAVYKAASAIRAGETPARHDATPGERWDIESTGDPDATHRAILSTVKRDLADRTWDWSQDVILIPRNGDNATTPASVRGLNADLAEIMTPRSGRKYEPGDRIIITRNFPDADLWNGTTGTVAEVQGDGRPYVALDVPAVRDDGPEDEVLLTREQTAASDLAFALTVHKAQGSQYRRVLFAALQRDAWGLLDRSLIYTAVTRTRERCTVVGQPRALADGIGQQRHKQTCLQRIAARDNA